MGGQACAGIGIAMGVEEDDQWALPVDERLDFALGVRRTSQRAELLAAIQGLRKMEEFEAACSPSSRRRGGRGNEDEGQGDPRDYVNDVWVVVSDSEYVVKGMSEWVRRLVLSLFSSPL